MAAEFAKLGAEVIDVDLAGHDVIEGPATKRNSSKPLVQTFSMKMAKKSSAHL